MAKRELKMFVWRDVLCDYTCGMIVAMAYDVEEARALLRAEGSGLSGDEAYEANKEPDEIFTSPAAVAVGGGG